MNSKTLQATFQVDHEVKRAQDRKRHYVPIARPQLIQRVPRSEAMADMKAMESTDKLHLQPVRRPVPEPQAGEILIQALSLSKEQIL